MYAIKIPNYEIQTLFRKIILNWFEVGLKVTRSTLYNMVTALTENRIKAFEKLFKQVMGDTFSYFDIDKNPEAVWQAYVLGLLSLLKNDYHIKSNRESGLGRYDVLLLPKDTANYGVVMEIKAMEKKATQQAIENKLTQALAQIKENEYYQELVQHKIDKRIEIAVVFAGKKVFIKN